MDDILDLEEEREEEKEEERESENRTPGRMLRSLVDLREQVQRTRIQFNNRLAAVDRRLDPAAEAHRAVLEHYLDRLRELEEAVDSDITRQMEREPLARTMEQVKGIGPLLAAQLIALIDVERSTTVSQLWRHAGLAVINGRAERMVKGEKAHYSNRLKRLLHVVVVSLLRQESPYRQVYDEARRHYAAHRSAWTRGHQHLAALRKVKKLFLCHLWETWRLSLGLPIRVPYVIEYLGHHLRYRAADFGWQVVRVENQERPVQRRRRARGETVAVLRSRRRAVSCASSGRTLSVRLPRPARADDQDACHQRSEPPHADARHRKRVPLPTDARHRKRVTPTPDARHILDAAPGRLCGPAGEESTDRARAGQEEDVSPTQYAGREKSVSRRTSTGRKRARGRVSTVRWRAS
jgi:hypothetical protein